MAAKYLGPSESDKKRPSDAMSGQDDPRAGAGSALTVRNSKTGKMVVVNGFGALKDSGFEIRKGIDLTQPIAKQVLRVGSLKAKSGIRARARKVPGKD